MVGMGMVMADHAFGPSAQPPHEPETNSRIDFKTIATRAAGDIRSRFNAADEDDATRFHGSNQQPACFIRITFFRCVRDFFQQFGRDDHYGPLVNTPTS